MSPSFVYRLLRRPPVIFPLVALFLSALTALEAYQWLGDPSVFRIYWFRPLILLAYTISWVGACLFKKWGAISFLALSVANVCLYLLTQDNIYKQAFGDILFSPIPMNLFLSFLLLFYFKRMD